ncbi:MAG: T9SS type A sorting domain-containing protein [Ignavibacteriales bacterium]|nr:T9SS type A sorting domain-containing protein [Ignavibacteriales bacterium]
MMRNILTFFLFSICTLIGFGLFDLNHERESFNYQPADWFYYQRAYPNKEIPFQKYLEAAQKKQQLLAKENSSFDGAWKQIGPSNIGGRITALAVNSLGIKNIIVAGAAAGGVFTSGDGGVEFHPTMDNYASLSIGALKADPGDPKIIYCGTGEANTSGDSYPGFGIYKSYDNGSSWLQSGLTDARHIAEIEVHSNLVFAAVAGGLYSKDSNRGIYRSTDAGASWERVLFISDSTSAIDVAIDPSDINIVYAAMWERQRGPSFRKVSGFTSGIYKSTDMGNTWTKLTNGLPVSSNYIGRISIAVAPSNSDFVYALYKVSTPSDLSENIFGGFYRSTNKGTSWEKMPDGKLGNEFSNFGWYFGLLEVDPKDYNTVYVGEIDLLKTTDGGNSWKNITNSYSGSFDQQHPDQHALYIDPINTNNLVVGNDGGIFTSSNGGTNWKKLYNLPITQFYASTIDYLHPDIKLGGTQDNGTMKTRASGIDDWEVIYGGDGFHCKVDYTNSNIIYTEFQWGGLGKSTDGGANFYYGSTNGIDQNDRRNWSTPFTLDVLDPTILYYGTYRIYRSTDGAQYWSAISPDLTRGKNGKQGTITCISTNVLPDNNRVIYTGTDDGKVSVSTNTGISWKDITGNLPRRYVTDILCDRRDASVAYVTLSGYNQDLKNPHIFQTTNFGESWTDISDNLPDVPLNSVVLDYEEGLGIYIGGDLGVYYKRYLTDGWKLLGSGLPNSPISDLNYHQPTKKLVAATHGRSMFEIDLTNIVKVDEERKNIPESITLYQNYPNPFNPNTVISFRLLANNFVTLKVFDNNGKEVSTLVDGYKPAGIYNYKFSANNCLLPSGIYFYQLKAGNYSLTKKMLLLK